VRLARHAPIRGWLACFSIDACPSKTLLRPGEGVRGPNEAAATAEVDIEAVSNYSDAGQERWLAEHGIDLLRGRGRLAGTGVFATGSNTLSHPARAGVPGLRWPQGHLDEP
jgi:hypothetical protein